MKISYDSEVDALSITFHETTVTTRDLGDGIAADFDAQGLTYTTDALESDVEATGYPIARVWVSSTADDGDFYVKLQDVNRNGVSQYVPMRLDK